MVETLSSPRLNNSMSEREKVEKTLQSIKEGAGGTVTYVFLKEKYICNKKFPEGKTFIQKSFLHAAVNPEVFFKFEGGKKARRTLAEVIEVFESSKADLNASEYIID